MRHLLLSILCLFAAVVNLNPTIDFVPAIKVVALLFFAIWCWLLAYDDVRKPK